MNILITGANGFIGRHLLKTCLAHGHQVTACVRDTAKLQRHFPEVQVIQCDFSKDQKISDWLPRLNNIDVVINAVGIFQQRGTHTFAALHRQTPRALFKACEIMGIIKVVQISALGADDSAFSQYHLSKNAADDFLSTLDLNWAIVMPSIVYGPGAQSLRLFKAMAALPFTPLVDDGSQQIQPIHIGDLSNAVLQLIESETPIRQRIAAVGPDPVSFTELYGLLKSWLGITQQRFIKIPYGLALLVARVAGVSCSIPVSADALKMLQAGNTANVQAFINIFGFTPASLSKTFSQQPPLESDYLDAKLYFLLPLLRYSLAVLWVASGLLSAFAYPMESSYAMLNEVGIPNSIASATLYSASALDTGLGVALLFSYRLPIVLLLQIVVMLVYTAIITFSLPELWLHPFGPVTKNIPLIAATWLLLAVEK
ncbi:MAG: hypothetical protein AMJ53_07210 [Gammaproteobacteria bacterium SG8_11]|nr:MAG: hypothetical protein AMJ53_07210 [Gammaproteobacteria bacterium SG8_11]